MIGMEARDTQSGQRGTSRMSRAPGCATGSIREVLPAAASDPTASPVLALTLSNPAVLHTQMDGRLWACGASLFNLVHFLSLSFSPLMLPGLARRAVVHQALVSSIWVPGRLVLVSSGTARSWEGAKSSEKTGHSGMKVCPSLCPHLPWARNWYRWFSVEVPLNSKSYEEVSWSWKVWETLLK